MPAIRKNVEINVSLPPEQALALAQLLKRMTWSDFKGCSVDDDEAYVMRDAADVLRTALAEAGYNPR